MCDKKALFIYPNTSESYKAGGNSYIRNLIAHLSASFTVVNKKTSIGLLDMLLKLPKCDALYFNWIEDVAERRFGFLQVWLLTVILVLAKMLNIKIIWFIHNNVSHSRRHGGLKKFIVRLMRNNADVILSHASKITLKVPPAKFHTFDHPLDAYQPLVSKQPYLYDLLIWGTVSPYKGITEFIDFVSAAPGLKDLRILIAGKFYSTEYYEELKNKKPANVIIQNKIVPEPELIQIFSESHYVLFTYNSPSVLSSAALCKTLSFGKDAIGPDIGSFRELGRKNLLHNYQSFSDLEKLLNDLKGGLRKAVDKAFLADYVERTSWDKFADFLAETINETFKDGRFSRRHHFLNETIGSPGGS